MDVRSPTLLLMAGLACAACESGDPAETSNPAAADPVPAAPAWFADEAGTRGIIFTHDSGHRDRYRLPESIGGGAALFDMDGDGDLDAYLVQGGALLGQRDPNQTNRLFRNDGAGHFDDVTGTSGAGDAGYGMAPICGDYDNDGDVDLYITNLGANVLLANDGEGRFTDVTRQAGVGHEGWGTSGAFADFDRDGDLDLFVCNYVNWQPSMEVDCYNDMGALDYCLPVNYDAPGRDVLYRNNGDGTFTDISDDAGLTAFFGTGLGVVAADFTGDGWLDFFVANDAMRDQLWINQRDGRFVDEALRYGCAYDESGRAKAGMGVDANDVDDDGDPDLIVCNLGGETDSFYLNDGGRLFIDHVARSGVGSQTRVFTRFGVGWFDLDCDGILDLFEANGRVMRKSHQYADDPYAEPNSVLRGVGLGRFERVEPQGGTRAPLFASSRAAAFGDVNGDGAVDVLVANRDGLPHLLINVIEDRGNWVVLRLIDQGRDAYNAVATITVGERLITRAARANASYLASNDPRIHLGLGEATTISDVTVTWVDGTREAFGDFSAGGVITITRGAGSIVQSGQ